mgnify:CR=1 FL=1
MSSSLPQEESLESTARTYPPGGRLARTFSALRYRDYRLLWFGAFMSTTGTWMQTVAQGWVVLQMTNSAFLLGVDGFLSTGPMLMFSLFGGVVADRLSRRKIMIYSQYAQMGFAFILAFLIYFDQVKVWHIFLLSFLTGSAQSFSGPAYISLLPLLVKREDLPNAVAMNSMQFNLARVVGPILAGVALAAWGAAAWGPAAWERRHQAGDTASSSSRFTSVDPPQAASIVRMTQIMRRHGIMLPAQVAMLIKALVTLEGALTGESTGIARHDMCRTCTRA